MFPIPLQVAAEMVRLARPGGWVAAMEPTWNTGMCYPPGTSAWHDDLGG
jgi:hypothetical protein